MQLAHRQAEEWLHSDDYRACIDFHEFQMKLKRQTFWNQDLPLGGPRSLSLRMLYQVPGIGKEAAQPIIATHPTLAEIMGALNANGNKPCGISNSSSSNNCSSSSNNCSSSSGYINSSSGSNSLGAGAGMDYSGGVSAFSTASAHTTAATAPDAGAIGDGRTRTPTKLSPSTTTATSTAAAVTPSSYISTEFTAPPTTKKRKARGQGQEGKGEKVEPLVFPSCGPHKNNLLKTFFCTYF